MVGAQLDLFADRHVRLEGARRALAHGRPEDACGELVQLRRRYPDDAAIALELETVRALVARLEQIDGMPAGERARAIVEVTRRAGESARPWLLRRAAMALREASGSTGLIEGKAASVLLLAAGDPHTAWSAAADAVGDSPRARFLAYLADVEHRLGQKSRTRARYREALAMDPFDVDWDEVADEEVKALPEVAEDEMELEDGIAWSAPVGVVLKVLPAGEAPPSCAPHDPRNRSALVPPCAFLHALLRARLDPGTAIEARRQMRALAPRLLAAYLESR